MKILYVFFECDSGITGCSLADKITSSLQSFRLDLAYLRGQGYDGAGNMAGSVNGAAAVIAEDYPSALYFHCTSHCLNLAVVKSLQLTSIHNMMGVVDKYTNFVQFIQKGRELWRKQYKTHSQSKKNTS